MAGDANTQMKSIGKGIVQINLRLSRILEAVETAGSDLGGDVGGAGGSATLDVLLDLLDTVTRATCTPGLPVRRRWWQVLAPPAPHPDPRLAGVALAREHALARLASMGIEPIDSSGAFDPVIHQAVERRTTPKASLHGTIAAELRPGWIRVTGGAPVVIRPAQVTVFAQGEQ